MRSIKELQNIRIFTKSQFITLVVIICLIPLFEPRCFAYIPSFSILNSAYSAGKIVSGLLIILLLFRNRAVNGFSVCIILLSLVMLISTLLNGGSAREWVSDYVSFTLVALLVIAVARDHQKEALRGVQITTSILLMINFISMLIYPDGMYAQIGASQINNYFWGHRNNTYMLAIPALVSSLLLDDMRGKKIGIFSLAIFACSYFEILYRFSATSFLALALFTLGFLFIQSKRVRKKLNLFTYCVAYGIAFVCIVLLRLQLYFSDFFENVLGRSATLTGRTEIWDYVFSLMQGDQFLTGYGLLSRKILELISPEYSHAHNMLLDIWFCGGYLAIIIFLIIIFLVAFKTYRCRASMQVGLIALGIGCFFLIGITERTSCEALYLLLAFGYIVGQNNIGLSQEEKYMLKKHNLTS